MIGFVTWPPFVLSSFIRWPSDKANHSCENALYVIQVKEFFWSLITIFASDWPHTFLQPSCFLFSLC